MQVDRGSNPAFPKDAFLLSIKIFSYGDTQIISKNTRKIKWNNFDGFVNILKKYVDNAYYGGFECKIEKVNIVGSSDWRRRKYEIDNG